MVPATRRQARLPSFSRRYVATARDVETELKRIGHTLSPLEIVVINTSAGAKYGRQDYVDLGCGMGYEATMYLLERGVRLTGIDGWSWDAPFVYTAKKYAETKNANLIWEGHKAGRHIGYCHIEKLHNLEQCHRPVSPCRAFRSRSNARRRAGPGRSPFSIDPA